MILAYAHTYECFSARSAFSLCFPIVSKNAVIFVGMDVCGQNEQNPMDIQYGVSIVP